MHNNIRISVHYLSIGSGHQKAAEAVYAAIKDEFPHIETVILDPFSRDMKVLPSLLELGLIGSNYLVPNVYEKVWRNGNRQATQLVRKVELLQHILTKTMDHSKHNITVATHGLPCLIASACKQDQTVAKVFGVLTDFGVHSFWHQTNADGFFCGHAELADHLNTQGIPRENLFATGIPIHKQFSNIPDRERQRFPESLQVLFIAGGMRGGPYLEIERSAQRVISACEKYGPPNMHLTIITGRNQRLFDYFTLLQPTLNLELSVHGFVKNMYQFMAENDVIITKPGGLITAESLASGLGILMLKPGPGQEAANKSFLLRHGAGLPGDTMESLHSSMLRLHDPSLVQKLRQNALAIGKPNASTQVARILKGLLIE